MSRKHNVAKTGSSSRYPDRLLARGENSASVRMPFITRDGRQHDDWQALHRPERAEGEQ